MKLLRHHPGWYENADGTVVVREIGKGKWIVERYSSSKSGMPTSYSDFMPTFRAAKQAALAVA